MIPTSSQQDRDDGDGGLRGGEPPEKCRRGIGLRDVHRYRGEVSSGYGRGGKQLGVPTANLPSSLFQKALGDVEAGVYFGWAAIEGRQHEDPDSSGGAGSIFKAVVNVGYSPTFEGRENGEKIIEAHLIRKGDEDDDGEPKQLGDFYGSALRLMLVGFLRPERKFDGFPALIAQINADIADSAMLLDETPYRDLREDKFFDASETWIGSGGGDEDASWEFSSMSAALECIYQDRFHE